MSLSTEIKNKANYSSVVAGLPGYETYKTFGVKADDPKAFNTKDEVDAYLSELRALEDELLKNV